ncbi:hypothetical protein N0V85_006435 [Neurospora sp. IMI 360204]|nr:hypothetical protein N0V85_006435 [Neurospora sp. IMI 360204]
MMDTSKDIIPKMADERVNSTPSLVGRQRQRQEPIPSRQCQRGNSSAAEKRESHDENDVNWRHLSQPRQRRLLASRIGSLPFVTPTPINDAFTTPGNAFDTSSKAFAAPKNTFTTPSNTSDQEPKPLYGSELRIHFASLEKTAVEASTKEHISNVEMELKRLREERKNVLREMDEMELRDVVEMWEEGIMMIDDIINDLMRGNG